MELKFDGPAQLLRGQPLEWILAACLLLLCAAVLTLSVAIVTLKLSGARR